MLSLKNSAAVFSLSTCVALAGVVLLWRGGLQPLSLILGIFTGGAILGRILSLQSHAIVAFLLLVIGTSVVSQATTPLIRRPTLDEVWGNFLLWALWGHAESPTMGWDLVGLCALGLGLGMAGIFVGHHLRPSPVSSASGHASRPEPLEN
jgi:hypothetical protein